MLSYPFAWTGVCWGGVVLGTKADQKVGQFLSFQQVEGGMVQHDDSWKNFVARCLCLCV